MPGGDRTGPIGAGPMTGRGLGYCAGYGRPGWANPGYGRGMGFMGRGFGGGFGRGFGRGGGRGWGRSYYGAGFQGWAGGGPGYPVPTSEPYPWFGGALDPGDELTGLRDEAKYYGKTLEEINKRIDELQKEVKQAKEK